MKGMILYKSKYGATEKYAGWLKEATGFDCMETSAAQIGQVCGYDAVVLCGGVYAGGVAGLSFLKKHGESLKGKRLAVLAVGASPFDPEMLEQSRARQFKGDMADVPLFYARGAWNPEGMGLMDRTLCRMLKKAVSGRMASEAEPWMTALLQAGDGPCDWTDPAQLAPLTAWLRDNA